MYIIINRTLSYTMAHEGDYPYNAILDLLKEDNDIIIISTYSNTIKYPYVNQVNGIEELEGKEYQLPDNIINPDFIKLNSSKDEEQMKIKSDIYDLQVQRDICEEQEDYAGAQALQFRIATLSVKLKDI